MKLQYIRLNKQLNYKQVNDLFDDITVYGDSKIIGENFLVCKDLELPDYVWSYVMIGNSLTTGIIYELIYKYDGS